MSTISIRLEEKENKLIREYAKMHNISVSELVRKSVLEKIEDEIDLELFDKAFKEIKETYTVDEVKKELGL